MIKETIYREDAIKAMEQRYQDILRIFKRKVKDGENAIVLDMIGCIKSLPSADRPSKEGEWEIEEFTSIYGKGYRLTCSECGDVFTATDEALLRERYCRYCGAKNSKRWKGADDETD